MSSITSTDNILKALREVSAASLAGGMIAASKRSHSIKEAVDLKEKIEERLALDRGTFSFNLDEPHV